MSLEDYEPVAQRLDRWFGAEIAAGHVPRVVTTMLSTPGADTCVFRAELWRILILADGAGERAILLASGHAEEVRGANNINRSSHLEACETSAVGRALSNWNLAGSDWTKRASREEMQKVQRYTGPSQTTSNPHTETVVRGPMTGGASDKQIGYIKGACKREGSPTPIGLDNFTKQQASDWIEAHKNGTHPSDIYNPQLDVEEPF